MKKIFSTLGVLIIISSVMLAGGTDDPSTTSNMAVVKTTSGVKVFYKSDKKEKVKVTIFNSDRKKIFSEEVNNISGFIRPYNLSSLPEGDYRFVLEDENGIKEKTISNVKEDVEVLTSIINARKQYNKCLVTLFSKGESEVTVKLMDENKNVLALENYTVNGQSSKLFGLENLKGAVAVEVSDKRGVIKSVTLK